ncbi:hypothetical protein C2845_PM14G02490 [Panicum miliaceum]|uniref:Uncharacterized protein n=1 Tax=Panicum miliaceum TaxID=4540 RepID=A0A3L6PS99_PANMI|nr:hypothetical protein C2845_PM14G02490 [Panicum miliaceum]
MPTTPSDDGRIVIAVDPITARHVDAAGGDDVQKQQSESSESEVPSIERREVQQSETISADMVRKKLKKLDVIMFCVAFLEWADNAVGTLGFLWATVVMLGGFCSLLSRLDFWFSAIMVFIEGSRLFSTSVTVALLVLSNEDLRGEDDSSLLRSHSGQYNSSCGLLLNVLDKTILPILFLWSVVFPVPGISLQISFYMLFSVIAALLLANLQIPVAFLQILLSIMRLRSLLGHHNHDYRPLPKDASPNFVPSIVVFFMLELCQGSSYILATILGLISLFRRRSLARDLGFKRVRQFWGGFENEWAENAVDLYCHKAYEARKEKGLFPSNNSMPSLTSLAIESLDSTSTEMQIAGLHVLDNFLERFDHTSKEVLIAEITYAVPTLIDILGSSSTSKDIRLLSAKIIENLSDRLKISEFPSMVKLIPSLLERQPYALKPLGDRRGRSNARLATK